MKNKFSLETEKGSGLLSYYRRVVGIFLRKRDVDPNGYKKYAREQQRVRQELLKRLNSVRVLVFTDYAHNTRVVGPFFSESDIESWLRVFWGDFTGKFGSEKMKEIQVHYKIMDMDKAPLPSQVIENMRNNGAHVVL